MKNTIHSLRLVTSLFATLVMTIPLFAQDNMNHRRPRYRVQIVPTLGGPGSQTDIGPSPTIRLLNTPGTLAPSAQTSTPDPFFGFVVHGLRFRNGVTTELPTLPPADINTGEGLTISDNGLIAGFSENGDLDPLTGYPEFEAVLWRGTHITDLGNFGGNGSLAFSVNNRGQVVGWAKNTIPDQYGAFLMYPTGCLNVACFPMAQQVRAFLWQNGVMQDLGTLGGNDAVAGVINQSGQVAGTSYTNTIPNPTTGFPSQDPFFWERGRMTDIGNLGGTFAYANSMNERGQVVGLSTLAGDAISHPFLWDRGGLIDLGTFGGTHGEAHSINDAREVVGAANLAGDQSHHAFLWRRGMLTDLGSLGGNNTAWAINSSGQVVGASAVTSGAVHAFLWEKGKGMIDLNDLVPPGSGFYLENAFYLNDGGQIAGDAVLDSGEERAYLLTPCDDDQPGNCRSDMVTSEASRDVDQAAKNDYQSRRTGDEPINRLTQLRERLANQPHLGVR